MKRKLVKQGPSSLMMSIPSKWIKKNNLEKGDEIELEEENNSLIISKGRMKKSKEIVITIDDDNKHDLKTLLTQSYRKGYDRIIINSTDAKTFSEIEKTTTDLLLGFDVVEKAKDHCVLENISEPSEEKYEVLIRRIFLIIRETLNEISENVPLLAIDRLRTQQDKQIMFCRRILEYRKDSVSSWELLTALRHIEHKLYYMYKYMLAKKFKPDKEFQDLLKVLQATFDLLYDAYFNRDVKKIHALTNLRNEYYFDKCISALEKSSGKKAVVLSFINESFRLLGFAASPVLNELIDSY